MAGLPTRNSTFFRFMLLQTEELPVGSFVRIRNLAEPPRIPKYSIVRGLLSKAESQAAKGKCLQPGYVRDQICDGSY